MKIFDIVEECGKWSDVEDLLSVVLVCKAWNGAATKFLWKKAVAHWRILDGLGVLARGPGTMVYTVSFDLCIAVLASS